jgi:hypothetical protein
VVSGATVIRDLMLENRHGTGGVAGCTDAFALPPPRVRL